jgi:hypothetical protein
MKVGASISKQCPFLKKMEALKYSIDFVKTCNLKLLYLVFENEVNLTHLNMLLSNTLFRHFYDATIGNIDDVVYIYLKQGIMKAQI